MRARQQSLERSPITAICAQGFLSRSRQCLYRQSSCFSECDLLHPVRMSCQSRQSPPFETQFFLKISSECPRNTCLTGDGWSQNFHASVDGNRHKLQCLCHT